MERFHKLQKPLTLMSMGEAINLILKHRTARTISILGSVSRKKEDKKVKADKMEAVIKKMDRNKMAEILRSLK